MVFNKVLLLDLVLLSLIKQQSLKPLLSLNVHKPILLLLPWKLTTLFNLNNKNPLKIHNLRLSMMVHWIYFLQCMPGTWIQISMIHILLGNVACINDQSAFSQKQRKMNPQKVMGQLALCAQWYATKEDVLSQTRLKERKDTNLKLPTNLHKHATVYTLLQPCT